MDKKYPVHPAMFDADQGPRWSTGDDFRSMEQAAMHRDVALSRAGRDRDRPVIASRDVAIPPLGLVGTLRCPEAARALVIFAHGSGSSRLSPRNIRVAEALNDRGMATLLFDLLMPEEEGDRRNVFDIKLLGRRLVHAVKWIVEQPDVGTLPLGLFGASTGAAAALVAAGSLGGRVGAVVSRGGRPDLAGHMLPEVKAPTLLIVGGADFGVIELNQWALERLGGRKSIEIVPGATHLFPEPGALEAVIELAAEWFNQHLVSGGGQPADANQDEER